MSLKHFTPAPREAILSFGGFSFIHPDFWETYLIGVIREDFPDYFADYLSGKWNTGLWREKESCILTSLEAYLFHQFGILVPEQNLFQVYNKEGQGLELPEMLEAISSVIEPLGLEVEWVLAVDPEIRAALGESDKVIGPEGAEAVNEKPGICMINVENGYSHAFFWRKIDKRGFKNEKFRMVLLIKKITEDGKHNLSALESLKSFIQYFQGIVTIPADFVGSGNGFVKKILAEIQTLVEDAHDSDPDWDEEIRNQIDQHLASLLDNYRQYTAANILSDTAKNDQSRILLAAGQMVRKVVCEVEAVS